MPSEFRVSSLDNVTSQHFTEHHNGRVHILQDHQGYMLIGRVDYNTLIRNIGEIPSMKIFESDKTLAFLDIGPLSKGHSVRPFWTLF